MNKKDISNYLDNAKYYNSIPFEIFCHQNSVFNNKSIKYKLNKMLNNIDDITYMILHI